MSVPLVCSIMGIEDVVLPIQGRYAMLTHVPIYQCGDVFKTEPLWEKDLSLHFDYIDDFHIYCPLLSENAAQGASLAEISRLTRDRIHPIPNTRVGWLRAITNILPTFMGIRRAVKENDIVHVGAAGWPFSFAFYVLLLRQFHRFKWIMLIESSFWRLEPGEPVTLRKLFAHHAYMTLLPRCFRLADARIFTQTEYRRTFLGETTERTLVSPAVWYDADCMETAAGLAARQAATRKPRVIFPSRLVTEKGVRTILEAVRCFNRRRSGMAPLLSLDIMGEGDLAAACRAFAETEGAGAVRTRFLDPVPYGQPFLMHLRGYDALLVANQKAEQPRIIFDAFSQGLPVIASRTPGTSDIVAEGQNAEMFDVGDAEGLADQLERIADDRSHFAELGRQALRTAAAYTHREMHRVRHKFLLQALSSCDDVRSKT